MIRADADDAAAALERRYARAVTGDWAARWPRARAALLAVVERRDPLAALPAALERAGRVYAAPGWPPADLGPALVDLLAGGYATGYGEAAVRRSVMRADGPWEVPADPVLGAFWGAVDPVAPFTVLDQRAQAWLARDTLFWVGGAWSHQLGQRIAHQAQLALAAGEGRELLGQRLRAALTEFARPEAYWTLVGAAAIVRARAYGAVAGFTAAGVTEVRFRAMMDERTCCAAGTMVRMADGTDMPIESVSVGDSVLSCRGLVRKVTTLWRRTMEHWVTVRFGDSTLRLTPDHPVMTHEGWIRASDLRPGDRLLRATGTDLSRLCRRLAPATWAVVAAVLIDAAAAPAFDLEVEHDHGYIAEGVVVHNSPVCRHANGRLWRIERLREHVQALVEAENPEDVKRIAPWLPASQVTAMSQDEMAAAGVILPPLHGRCRSKVVAHTFGAD